jgi:hypothetical protein
MYSTHHGRRYVQPCTVQHLMGKRSVKKILKIVGVLFLLGVAANALKGFDSSKSVKKNDGQATEAQVQPVVLPNDQTAFIQIVQKAQKANFTAENDMQKGGVRANREKELCSTLASLSVTDWVGDVYEVTSNSDGKGVLTVTIAPDVYIKTWNNAVSDVLHNTLIEPNALLFNQASQLKEGQKVKFSGSFFRETEDSVACLSESSLTLNGKISEPEFIFRFSDVGPY